MQQRKISLDIMKIFAIFWVIYTHIGFDCNEMFAPESSTVNYVISCLLGIFCRVAVPIFFMASGALLLNKNESYKVIFKKRVFRFAVVLFVISAVVYLVQWNNHSIMGFFSALYTYKAAPSLWYLYSFLELLLLLPFLRKIAQAMSKKDYLYYFILQVLFVTIFPTFETATGIPGINLTIVLTTRNIFYFMMGHFFMNVADKSFYSKKNLLILNIGAVLFIAACFVYLSVFYTKGGVVTSEDIDVPLFAFISVPTFAVFFDIKYIFDRITVKERTAKVLKGISTATFGVYLIQGMFINYTQPIAEYLSSALPAVVSGLVYTIFVTVACTLIIIPIRNLPLIKKFI